MALTSTVDADDVPSTLDGGSWLLFMKKEEQESNASSSSQQQWFMAEEEEEEEESNEEEEEGSGREIGPRGHQQNTKMALRKKKNQML